MSESIPDPRLVPGTLVLDELTQRGGKVTHVNPAVTGALSEVLVQWAGSDPDQWVPIWRLRVW